MQLAAEQLEARFGSLLKTVEVTLRSSQGWGKMPISTRPACCASTNSSSPSSPTTAKSPRSFSPTNPAAKSCC
jgi:hypothetical protein